METLIERFNQVWWSLADIYVLILIHRFSDEGKVYFIPL